MKWLFPLILICGCGVTAAPPQDANPQPKAETVLVVLADNIVADPVFYSTTDDVLRVVNRLVATKRITQAQADACGVVLKGRRPILKADIDELRRL